MRWFRTKALQKLCAAPSPRAIRRCSAPRSPASPLPDIVPPRAIPRPQPDSTISAPPYRRIRTYAVDPSFSTSLETSAINQGLLKVRWEPLQPGPMGEYIQVADKDEDGTVYAPANLDDSRLLARDGFDPAEGNPQFHQHMVYAVSMTTISNFETAMGGGPLALSHQAGEPVRRQRIRPAPDHPAARVPPAERILRSVESGAAIRLFPRLGERSGRPCAGIERVHLPVARHRRPRNDARHS